MPVSSVSGGPIISDHIRILSIKVAVADLFPGSKFERIADVLLHFGIRLGCYFKHRRISRHSLGGVETNVALMTSIRLSVFALISIMKILFSHENLPFFALISSQPEC